MKARLPQWALLRTLARLENCLLEIFIIHGYLFMHVSGHSGVDFLLSLAVIIPAALVLNYAGTKLVESIFSPGAARNAPRAAGGTPTSDPLDSSNIDSMA